MPPPQVTRQEVVDRLLEAFRSCGYDGASLAELSQATGLGKSSLYHYFPGGKEEMGAAVLERALQFLEEHALFPLRQKGDPSERLRKMTRELSAFYQGGEKACILGSLVSGTARGPLQSRLREIFARWIQAISDLLIETGLPRTLARQRAENAVAQIQGFLILSRGLDSALPFRRMLRQMPGELFRP